MPSKRKAHPLESLTFDAPAAPAPTAAPTQAAAPAERAPALRASNVTLPVDVWEWIDRKQAEARSRGGAAFRKSAIIRAAFLVAMSVEVDLAGAQTEEEIAELMIRAVAQSHKRTNVR